jgi:FAD/FMN-containing dehydrogenase
MTVENKQPEVPMRPSPVRGRDRHRVLSPSPGRSVAAAAIELGVRLSGERVLTPGAASYEEARRIWNGAVDRRPAVIVRPTTPAEVQASIRAANDHRLPVSVRGGGHDWAGGALREGGLVIDLTQMRHVAVDADARAATVGGGATASEVVSAAAPHGLAAATGIGGPVGMAGLTLVGGYGPISGRFGLALDNLLSAQVVLADGRLVTADAGHEPELFWALRGGGRGLGVVTSIRIRLHPLERLLAGFIIFPWAQAAGVWERLRAVLADGPDELTVQTGILPGPDGNAQMFLFPAWSGDPAPGQPAIDRLLGLGTPLVSHVAPVTYAELLALFDPTIVNGRHYAVRTRAVADFTPQAINALTTTGPAPDSPLSLVTISHLHGAATRVASSETAFWTRRKHFSVEIIAAWEPDETDGARHRAWADRLSTALAPHALPGGYPGQLDPDDHHQIKLAYGENYPRLQAAKAHFDPSGTFTTPHPTAAERVTGG